MGFLRPEINLGAYSGTTLNNLDRLLSISSSHVPLPYETLAMSVLGLESQHKMWAKNS
jgi:hypothetical protein